MNCYLSEKAHNKMVFALNDQQMAPRRRPNLHFFCGLAALNLPKKAFRFGR